MKRGDDPKGATLAGEKQTRETFFPDFVYQRDTNLTSLEDLSGLDFWFA
jgi:hypothetical protein